MTGAAVVALVLAGYAVWATTNGGPPEPSPREITGTTRANAPKAHAVERRLPPPPRRPTPPRTQSRPSAEAKAPDEPTRTPPTPAEIADQRFQGPRNLFESAATTLRDPNSALNPASVTALLLQAELSIKDMGALADPEQPAHDAELRRIKKDFAALRAEFGR